MVSKPLQHAHRRQPPVGVQDPQARAFLTAQAGRPKYLGLLSSCLWSPFNSESPNHRVIENSMLTVCRIILGKEGCLQLVSKPLQYCEPFVHSTGGVKGFQQRLGDFLKLASQEGKTVEFGKKLGLVGTVQYADECVFLQPLWTTEFKCKTAGVDASKGDHEQRDEFFCVPKFEQQEMRVEQWLVMPGGNERRPQKGAPQASRAAEAILSEEVAADAQCRSSGFLFWTCLYLTGVCGTLIVSNTKPNRHFNGTTGNIIAAAVTRPVMFSEHSTI
ncbi:hypothetical protein C8J57DRAFT_1249062 [Mycena rebaudengoi]|nr:hypothetical protein C8J57DRAFT_1249062 [Mycena rebaudengoi]